MNFQSKTAYVAGFLAGFLLFLACAKREIVSEKAQRRSQKMMGQQEQGLSSMNQTPAEQAAARHEARTGPSDEPDEHDPQ